MIVLAILADYLRDNNLVQNCNYVRRGSCITCQFTTCPWADHCPLPPDQRQACRLLRQLAQKTLARGGYPAKAVPAASTDEAAEVAFSLRLLASDKNHLEKEVNR